MGACDHSCVLTDFDLANVNLDHSAVAIDLQWTQVASARIKAKTEIRDFERSLINKDVEQRLGQPIPCSWDDDVESQAKKITEHFHRNLAFSFPKAKHSPKKPYVSETLWQLRAQKIALRKQLRTCRGLLRREALARVFLAWRAGQNHEEVLVTSLSTLALRYA